MNSTVENNGTPINLAAAKTICEPSQVISYNEDIITLEGIQIQLILICMKRTLLLVIDKPNIDAFVDDRSGININKAERVLQGFSSTNNSLNGLSMAIGTLSTTLINSEHSIISSKLASNLSVKINQNRPVYVANNFEIPFNKVDDMFFGALNVRIFDYVRDHVGC